jgi:hypothetical protein
MKIEIHWQRKLKMVPMRSDEVEYDFELDPIPDLPGVYIFLRKHGRVPSPLYVGKTTSLRRRMAQYRNLQGDHAVQIMEAVRHAENGARWLVFGVFKTKRGQQEDRLLEIVERALIAHYLAQGHVLINTQGTRIPTNEITNIRNDLQKLIPMQLQVEQLSSHRRTKRPKSFEAALADRIRSVASVVSHK